MDATNKKNNEDEFPKDNELVISPAEMKRIQEATGRSDTEKFHLFTRMMRIHFMLRNAVVIKK